MKKIILIVSLFVCTWTYSQANYASVIGKTVEENTDSNVDSIARTLGYKGGDKIRVYARFKVNSQGEIHDIAAKGPHEIFEKEAIRLVKMVPQLDPIPSLKEGESATFNLPITMVIESDAKKKKRERKANKQRKKSDGSKAN